MRSHDLTKLAGMLNGLPVLGCRAGSPAQEAGMRYGDILLSVNGVPTPDWGAFIDARALDRTRMVVELFRDGETIVLTIQLAEVPSVDTAQLLAEMIAENIVPLPSALQQPRKQILN